MYNLHHGSSSAKKSHAKQSSSNTKSSKKNWTGTEIHHATSSGFLRVPRKATTRAHGFLSCFITVDHRQFQKSKFLVPKGYELDQVFS